MKLTLLLVITLVSLSSFCSAFGSNLGQYEILQRYCSNSLNGCQKDNACAKVVALCKSKNPDLKIVDCLSRSNSLFANKIVQCYNQLSEKKSTQLEIVQKLCSSQLTDCKSNSACSKDIEKCQSQNNGSNLISCLSQSNSLYANQIVKCYNQNNSN